jgi:hypothetical protein
LAEHPVTCHKMKFLTINLLLLAQSNAFAQGLIKPVDFYQEETEEDSSWEEIPPQLPSNGESEFGQL